MDNNINNLNSSNNHLPLKIKLYNYKDDLTTDFPTDFRRKLVLFSLVSITVMIPSSVLEVHIIISWSFSY